MSTEERLLRLENAFATLVELPRNIDERLDPTGSRVNTLESNLSALSDIVAEVARNQKRTYEQLNRTDELLKNLVAEGDRNQKRIEERLKRTDEQLAGLAALVEKNIRGAGNQQP